MTRWLLAAGLAFVAEAHTGLADGVAHGLRGRRILVVRVEDEPGAALGGFDHPAQAADVAGGEGALFRPPGDAPARFAYVE